MENNSIPHIDLRDGSKVLVAIISLEDALDRRKALEARGIPAAWVKSFFPAVDMRKSTLTEALRYVDQRAVQEEYGRMLRPPEVGCALSHREVARILAMSAFDMLLVLEDDVSPVVPNFLDEVESKCEDLHKHAKNGAAFFCHLGCRFRPAMRKVKSFYKDQSKYCQTKTFLHCDSDFDLWQTHAYIISKAAAIRICDEETPVKFLADDWSSKTNVGIFDQQFLCFPKIFDQDEGAPSSIQLKSAVASTPNTLSIFYRAYRSVLDGSFFSKLFQSISYRFRSKMSHVLALFPYKIP